MSEKLAVLGVGNILDGDDGVGPYVARKVAEKKISAFDCGTAPENFTSIIRKLKPETLVIVDASLMDLEPGSIRRIPPERIKDVAIGTHMLPLSCVAEYLAESTKNIVIIGIQPASLDHGDILSEKIQNSADNLIEIIANGQIETIPLL